MRERVINTLGLNRDGILQDKRIPKSKFFELDSFNNEKKRIFTEEINEVVLLAILNEETINIAPYKNDQVNYSEVYFIYIDLKSQKNIFAITEAIQKNIPNPCFLIFGFDNKIQLQTTIKRLSKGEQGKQVLEKEFVSEWISLLEPSSAEAEFVRQLNIANFSFENLYVFYTELTRLIYQSVLITILGEFNYSRKLKTDELRLYVDEYFDKNWEIARLKAEQIKTPDFAEQMKVQAKIIKAQSSEAEAKNKLITFLDTQQ